MKYLTAAISLVFLNFVNGCANYRSTVLVGGERQLFFCAGSEVPGVSAKDNTTGYYLLKAEELDGIVNP